MNLHQNTVERCFVLPFKIFIFMSFLFIIVICMHHAVYGCCFSFELRHHQWAATHEPANNCMFANCYDTVMFFCLLYILFLKAKLGDELLDYKDLAALPKIKAIYNIDRPDMLSYSPYVSYPVEDRTFGEVRTHSLLHSHISGSNFGVFCWCVSF